LDQFYYTLLFGCFREFYLTDSVFRNQSHLQTLVHSLYDLNAIDFNLPHKGYDLDRSFPSFSRYVIFMVLIIVTFCLF